MNNISDGFTICIFFITDEDMSENQNEMEIFKVQQHSDNELLSR